MARYHVKADGSMGVCTAQEGHCPFGGEEGTRHFTSKTEAQRYSEGRIKATGASSHERLKRDSGTKRSTASKREEDRVRLSSELLYGGVFTQDQLNEVGAKVDRVHERLMAPSWDDVKTALKQEYKGEDLDDALLAVSYATLPATDLNGISYNHQQEKNLKAIRQATRPSMNNEESKSGPQKLTST